MPIWAKPKERGKIAFEQVPRRTQQRHSLFVPNSLPLIVWKHKNHAIEQHPDHYKK